MKTFILVILCINFSYCQFNYLPIHSDKDGSELDSLLKSDFSPSSVLSYSKVKDTLYKKIYLENDSVSCVYTGLAKYLDTNEDPSKFLFQKGGNADINLEHCYPQSKGAKKGKARADMHHLFPTRVPVNSARAADPYKELPDNQTGHWYYADLTQSNIPSENTDWYSEDTKGGFEPREDFKGNVARACFYFYTIYQQEADAADPHFFDNQLATLCDWHQADPVDSLEWVRTMKIASYQDNKVNPFVLDCSLARLYCGQTYKACKSISQKERSLEDLYLTNSIIDSGGIIQLTGNLLSSQLTVAIHSLDNRLLSQTYCPPSGRVIAPTTPGMYLLIIKKENTTLLTTKIVIQ